MANEAELNELRERIGKLPFGEQLYLFEQLLGDHRRQCDEARVRLRDELEALRTQTRAHEEPKRAAG